MSAAAHGPAKESHAQLSLILFGLDEGRKPHASCFPPELADKALAAGEAMGMAALRLDKPELREIAGKLPIGKIFESGKAFVPFVKASTYDAIVQQLPEGVEPPKPRPTTPKAQKPGVPPSTYAKLPEGTKIEIATDWSKLVVGSLVLSEEHKGEGWWECIVVEVKDNDMFWLKWRDYPDQDNVARHRSQLGLLPPPFTATAAS